MEGQQEKTTETPMSNNTQLPADWKHKIENEAKFFANVEIGDWAKLDAAQVSEWEQTAANWEAGATEYATKLHQTEQERDRKKVAYELMQRTAEKYYAEIRELKAKVERQNIKG
jgi:exoribonuclease II